MSFPDPFYNGPPQGPPGPPGPPHGLPYGPPPSYPNLPADHHPSFCYPLQPQPRPQSYQPQPYMPNGQNVQAPPGALPTNAAPLLPNNGRVIQTGPVRVLCVADVRGNLRSLNELAKQANAQHIIHTGDFGFYDESSLERIADKTLKHVAQYSPLLAEHVKKQIQNSSPQQSNFKQRFSPEQLPLSELSLFIKGTYTLDVPVYTVWGACEDVAVLEKFRAGQYKIPNLHLIDEASSRLLDVGGLKLRLLGLGGAVVMHKLFDNGEGRTTIAGGQGTMWTTLLQMGELVDTSNRVYDPSETRVFVTHASPAREGLLNQLSVQLKADFSISAGLHFRYGSSYNEFSVNPTLDHYRGKLAASRASFNDVWETVKNEVEPAVEANHAQKTLLRNALDIVERMPVVANGGNPFGGGGGGSGAPGAPAAAAGQVDESAFKNMWNFNLADAAFGYLVLEIERGRIGTEMRAQGFNFAHRMTGGNKQGQQQQAPPQQQQGPPQGPPSMANNGPMGGAGGFAGPHGASGNPGLPMHQQQGGPMRGGPGLQGGPSPAQQNKGPTGPTRPGASPAPGAPAQAKPATPQPSGGPNVHMPPSGADKPAAGGASSSATTNGAPSDAKAGSGANGNSSGGGGGTPAALPPKLHANDKKVAPGTALFIQNVDSEPAARELFAAADAPRPTRVDRLGRNYVAHFADPDAARAALDRQPPEHRAGGRPGPPGPGQPPRKPYVKWFENRSGPGPQGGQGGASGGGPLSGGSSNERGQSGTWGPSQGGRGGNQGGTRREYQSGASDSEGGRRGGFGSRGGRGGRGGGERGDRGGGRGGRGGGERGGRGGFAKSGGDGEASGSNAGGSSSAAPAAAAASPAPASKPADSSAPAPAGESS